MNTSLQEQNKAQNSKITPAQPRVRKTNTTLREELGIPIKIDLAGNRLRIRKTLPPRPRSEHKKWHQQTITLGLNTDKQGVQQALKDVIELNNLLSQRKFTWKDWERYLCRPCQVRMKQTETIEMQVKKFKAYFLTLEKQKITRAEAWNTQWSHYFNKLPLDQYLTDSILLDAISRKIDEGSSCRQKFCIRLKRFVEFLAFETEIDFVKLGKGYELPPISEDELPTDQVIADSLALITDPEWRAVYMLQAVFGLRNHEVFFLMRDKVESYEGIKILKVSDETKTGVRPVAALYPEWFDDPEWQLQTAKLPQIELDLEKTTLAKIGAKVTAAYKRFGIPFSPYKLRHAWARRAMEFGLSDKAAADFMGHSLEVHQKHYQRLIALKHGLRIVQSFMNNPKRPKPPQRSL